MLWLIRKINIHEKIKCNNLLKRIKNNDWHSDANKTIMKIEHGENFNWPELIQAILGDKAFMSGGLLAMAETLTSYFS